MDSMCSVNSHAFSIPDFSYFPVLIFSEPGAAQQLAHTDAAPVSLVGTGAPRVLEGLLAIQETTRFRTWHGVQVTPVMGAGGGESGEDAGKERGRRKRKGST